MRQEDSAHFRREKQPRRSDRVERSLLAQVQGHGINPASAKIDNLSPRGCRIRVVPGLERGSYFDLAIPGGASIIAQVRWIEGEHAGCEFPRGLTLRQYLNLLNGESVAAPGDPTTFLDRVAGILAQIRNRSSAGRVTSPGCATRDSSTEPRKHER
jgi:hypothetical protein